MAEGEARQRDTTRARKARARVRVVELTDECQAIIVEAVRAGNYLDTAGAAAGLSKETTYRLLRDGRRLSLLRGQRVRLSPTERRIADFSDAVIQALAESEVADMAMLERLGQGGLVVRKTETRRNRTGETVEVRETEQVLAPNPDVLTWRLERRFPKKYGRTSRVELSGKDGGPIPFEERTERLAAMLTALQAGQPPSLMETTGEVLDETDVELLGE